MKKLLALLLLMASPCYGATYYVDDTNGNDANTGTDTSNEWQTVEKACNTVAAGDHVFFQSVSNFDIDDSDASSAVGVIDTVGTGANPIIFEGYTTTPGDNGQATFDANANTLTNVMVASVSNIFYTFRNIRFTGASSHGLNLGAADSVCLVNCRADNNGGSGIWADNFNTLYECQIDNNTSFGADLDQDNTVINSKFFGNGDDACHMISGQAINTLAYNNTNAGIDFFSTSANSNNIAINCTVDGENAAGSIGLQFESTTNTGCQIALNNIIYDLATGINGSASWGDALCISSNNLLNSNTTDETNWPATVNVVTGAPAFTDEASDDYTLGSSSPALNAGYSLHTLDGGTEGMDIGAYQEQDAGGGGGILINPGMDGGMN